MYEVEAKIAVADAPSVAAKATALWGQPRGPFQEEDVFFASRDAHALGPDEALRARCVDGAWELTYKGPRQAADVKVRREENLVVAGDPRALLACLGFQPAAGLRKMRRTWDAGATVVTLDELDGLGAFVEVEALGDDLAASSKDVHACLGTLGLDASGMDTTPYLDQALAAGAACAWRIDSAD